MTSTVSTIDSSFFVHSILANSPRLSHNTDLVHNLWRECLKNDPSSRQAYELFCFHAEGVNNGTCQMLLATISEINSGDGAFSSKITRKLVLSNDLHVLANERQSRNSSSFVVSQVAFLQCSKPPSPHIICLPLLACSLTDKGYNLSEFVGSTLRPLLQSVYIPTLHHVAELSMSSSYCKADIIREILIKLLGELSHFGETQEQGSATIFDTTRLYDFSSIQTPMEEVQFWELYREKMQQELLKQQHSTENYMYTPDILREICSAWHDAKETFEILESSKDETFGTTSALSQFHRLAQELGEGGVIEGTLFRIFQLNSLHVDVEDKAFLSSKSREYDNAKNRVVFIYSQDRLKHLLDILTASIVRHICQVFASIIHTQRDSFNTLPMVLFHSFHHSVKILIDSYMLMVKKLTQLDLPCLPYPWTGESYDLSRAQTVLERLNDLLMMRTVQEEIEILSSETYIKKNGGTNNYQEPPQIRLIQEFLCSHNFLPTFSLSDASSELHRRCLDEFNSLVTPLEHMLSLYLKEALEDVDHSPPLGLSLLQRFSSLLHRPFIQRKMESVVQKVVVRFQQLFKDMLDEKDKDYKEYAKGKMSIVDSILRSRQRSLKARYWMEMIDPLISKNIAFLPVEEIRIELAEKTGKWEERVFQRWADSLLSSIESRECSEIALSKPLIFINPQSGMVETCFNKTHDELLFQARLLAEMEFDFPSSLVECLYKIEAIHFYAARLEKISTFYNEFEMSVLPEQKEILMDLLISFEDVIKRSKVTVSSLLLDGASACWAFLDTLQNAAERLKAENSHLQKSHALLSNLAVSLIDTNLVLKKSEWQSKWHELRKSFAVALNKFSSQRTIRYTEYWDFQMYKILDIGYIWGIKNIHSYIGETRCELIQTDGGVQLSPSIQSYRHKYYRSLSVFLEFPCCKFIGFGGQGSVFQKMPTRNILNIALMYKTVELFFSTLEEAIISHENHWVENHRITKFCFEEGKHSLDAQWLENCGQAFKQRFKALEKSIPDVHVIEPALYINTKNWKNQLKESINHDFMMLLEVVYSKVIDELRALDSFASSSVQQLKGFPRSLNEATIAKENLDSIKREFIELKARHQNCLNLLQRAVKLSSWSQNCNQYHHERFSQAMKFAHELNETEFQYLENLTEVFHGSLLQQSTDLMQLMYSEAKEIDLIASKLLAEVLSLEQGFQCTLCEFISVDVFHQSDSILLQYSKIKEKSDILLSFCSSFDACVPNGLESLKVLEDCLKPFLYCWDHFKEFKTQLDIIAKLGWINFRFNLSRLENFCVYWEDRMKGLNCDSQVTLVSERFHSELSSIRSVLPTLQFCTGIDFREVHWCDLLQGRLCLPKSVRLETLCCYHFLQRLDIIKEAGFVEFVKFLNTRARGEVTIRESLDEIEGWLHKASFKLNAAVVNKTVTRIVGNLDDLLEGVANCMDLLNTASASQFFEPFRETANAYEYKLSSTHTFLVLLGEVQRKVLYLDPIFLQGTLKSRKAQYVEFVAAPYLAIMSGIDESKPVILDLALKQNLIDCFTMAISHLNRCQKALQDCLEEKRFLAPRLYFVGDEELLAMIGEGSNTNTAQRCMKKLFQAIHRANVDETRKYIISIESESGEIVVLNKPVTLNEVLEDWFSVLVQQQKDTVSLLVQQKLSSKVESMKEHFSHPLQVLCINSQIKFTQDVEENIPQAQLNELLGEITLHFRQLTSYKQTEITWRTATKVREMIMNVIHQRDILYSLIKSGTREVSDWEWIKQLRYYVKKSCHDGKVSIHIGSAEFHYGYEYQGIQPQLVRTALTDKCFLAITQGAMLLGMGGNPIGGAGTGKTETVKALGGALGRHVLIFNCDEGIDFSTMGRLCAGLISSGAWGCFDEFNRCQQDQLSAIAQIIQVIQQAIKEKRSEIQLLDKIIKVDFHTAIFITLNPAGKAFLGRSIMPQTLTTLFRPIAMCAPNKQKIAEAFLYAEGFLDASNIANSTVNLFRLCSCFLSKQQHYDWGLRSLKSVLESASTILQRERCELLPKNIDEQCVVSRSILSSVLPGLVSSDRFIFFQIISDIFPGPLDADPFSSDITSSVQKVMKLPPYLIDSDGQLVEKVLQLHFTLNNRIGCLLLSPTFCGKTTLWKILKESLITFGLHVVVHAFNPKALHRDKLFGSICSASRHWSDGLLTKLVRDAAAQSTTNRVWIILDGDIDPVWIENLNSALDDSRVLTLPNGDRIPLGRNINFIFETCNLSFASPATISRMGLIRLSLEDVKLDLIVDRWVQTQPELRHSDLKKWIETHLIKLLALSAQFSLSILGSPAAVLFNTLTQITEYSSEADFLQNMIRGVCSGMEVEARRLFLTQAQQVTKHFLHDGSAEADGKFKNTQTGLITTKNACRGVQVLKAWLYSDFMHHLILIGPDGCGKETLLRAILPSSSHCITIQCNKETEPDVLIDVIKEQCRAYTSCRGRIYRPERFDRLYLLVKDANVSKRDAYGNSILQEFLQQLLSHSGFFDEQLTFILLQNVQIILSLNPLLLCKQPLQPRMASAARVLVLDGLSKIEQISICAEALKKKSAIIETVPTELSSDEGIEKVARTIVELVLEANAKCNLSMTSHDVVSWASSLYRYEETATLASCMNQETNRRIFNKISSDHEFLNQYFEFFRTLMKQEWNFNVGDYGANCSVCFQSIETRSSSRDGDTIYAVSPERFRKILDKGIRDYKQVATTQHLVLTPTFVRKFSEIDQVLSENGSSLILRSKSGRGCQESLRLLCFLKSWSLVAPCITSERSLSSDFMYFLEEAIELVATSKVGKVCLLMEHHVIDDSTLSYIDTILSRGYLSSMLEKEVARSSVSLKEAMVEDGTCSDVRDFLKSQIKSKLRFCLCVEENRSERFLINLRDHYPHVFKHCSLLNLQDWSSEDLRAACLELFLEFPSPHQNSDDGNHDNFVETAAAIHDSCISLNATPRHLVKMMRIWDMLFSRQYKKIHHTLTSLQRGLQKLVEARQAVSELENLVEMQREDVKGAQQKASDVMETISLALSEASLSRKKNDCLSIEMKEKTEKAMARRACIQKELDSISPSLEEAKRAVQGITSENLSEIRALKAPPEQISVVLSAVLLMLGFKDLSWLSMRSFLGNRKVKEQILLFDKESLSPLALSKVEALVKDRPECFDSSSIKRVSVACAPLAMWVTTTIHYAKVLEQVKPLQAELNETQAEVESLSCSLELLRKQLDELEAKVGSLKIELELAITKVATLKRDSESLNAKLQSSRVLLSMLKDEEERWASTCMQLHCDLDLVKSRTLLASAFIVYLCSEQQHIRVEFVKRWVDIQQDLIGDLKDFNLSSVLGEDICTRKWKLPQDIIIFENALIVHSLESEVPFVIDPDGIALAWLKLAENLRSLNQLDFLSANDPRVLSKLEVCCRIGKGLVLTDASGLDAILAPLLQSDWRYRTITTIQMGRKRIDVAQSFSLIIMTKLQTPIFLPGLKPLVNIVSFAETNKGVSEKLVNAILNYNEPALQKESVILFERQLQLKDNLSELEQQLLNSLGSTNRILLENEDLIQNLAETKAGAKDIVFLLESSRASCMEVNKRRSMYREFADKCSHLYFLMSRAAEISPMSRFNLASFIDLLLSALDGKKSKDAMSESSVYLDLTRRVYNFVAKTLSKDARLAFALYLVRSSPESAWTTPEWDVFTRRVHFRLKESSSIPPWVDKSCRSSFSSLHEYCPNIVNAAQFDDIKMWKSWFSHHRCEERFPREVKLTAIERLMVLQAFRPDRIISAVEEYCKCELGVEGLDPEVERLDNMFGSVKEINAPVLLIARNGADPCPELESLAEKNVGRDRVKKVAMIQSRQGEAIEMLFECAKNGDWLILQNIHFVLDWISTLEKVVEKAFEDRNASFILWLITEEQSGFPTSLIQNCLKVALEPPPGIKKNMLRSYDLWKKQSSLIYDEIDLKLFFIVAWFHAIVTERRSFLCHGWTKKYEFGDGDVLAAFTFLLNMRSRKGVSSLSCNVDWKRIHGLLSKAIYGSHIDDEFDSRLLNCYIERYFTSDVLNGIEEFMPGIRVPAESYVEAHLQLISKLPDFDDPTFFGLPSNIGRSQRKVMADSLVSNVFTLTYGNDSSVEDGHAIITADTVKRLISTWEEVAKCYGIPTNEDHFDKTQDMIFENSGDSLANFLYTERNMGLALCKTVNSYFQALGKNHEALLEKGHDIIFSVTGIGDTTPILDKILMKILRDEIPVEWSNMWAMKNSFERWNDWMEGLARRTKALNDLFVGLKDSDNSLIQATIYNSLNLNTSFNPEGVFTAFKVQRARDLKCSINDLVLKCSWSSNDTPPTDSSDREIRSDGKRSQGSRGSLMIKGLLIQGAIFDGKSYGNSRGKLADCAPDDEALGALPPVWITYEARQQNHIQDQESSNLEVPLYYNTSRETLVSTLLFPCQVKREHTKWIFAGVAVFIEE